MFAELTYRLGVDVGGTFTDFALVDDVGDVIEAKTPSTPDNPGEAIERGLVELSNRLGRPMDSFLADCRLLIHGTTVALNALLQQKGARTGLVCTEGFRDTLEIRLGYRDRRYDFRYPPPPILVPRHLRRSVRERVDKLGRIVTPLDEDDVLRAIEVFKREQVEAVAVCLLWSFYNEEHERTIGRLVKEAMPETYLSLSVDVAPQIREYDRVSTTVLNAYVGPRLSGYLEDTERFLRELGYGGPIRYIQSNGGLAAGDVIRKRAVLAINSGPAAAPAAGVFVGAKLGADNLITMDMGGTSFDACLIDHGRPDVKGITDVHRYRLAAPMVNINTIGAGGGSIARVHQGILAVGPQSAEAYPGPACYMRGGTQPTVTDADVVLGYLNPSALLGGRFPIDHRLAEQAIADVVARPLNLSVPEAALGIFEIVNRNMANAISEISLERGYDPRDFILVAAGGQGGVHAGELSRELAIPRVIVPTFASTFCAFGALSTDVRHDYRRSFAYRLSDLDLSSLADVLRDMEQAGYADLASEGIEPEKVVVLRQLDMRYAGQVYEVQVDVSGVDWSHVDKGEIEELLHRQHEKEYTYRHQDGIGEVINATVTVIGKLPPVHLPSIEPAGADASHALSGERPMLFRGFSGYEQCPVYAGAAMQPGNRVCGPAVVEEVNTTIVMFPDFEMELTASGAFLMTRVD
ncbi:MAG: 5-oxoprolinase [Candidatus Dormiibacter spiritus]|nr:MAG: 5-oxoprolinase [Candidatus Dormibacteraeota bacterium]